jgi:Phosphoglucomutase/phosphomannomutase, C-terminal domain
MVHEAEGHAGVPIGVAGKGFLPLISDHATDAGREEIKQLAGDGVTDRPLYRIGVAELTESVGRPPVVDAEAQLAIDGPGRSRTRLEIIQLVQAAFAFASARIGVVEGLEIKGHIFPLRRDAGVVVEFDGADVVPVDGAKVDVGPPDLKNVRYTNGQPLDKVGVERAINYGKTRLGNSGRLVIRPSGTEPVIRVMAEGDDERLVKTVVSEIAHALSDAAA